MGPLPSIHPLIAAPWELAGSFILLSSTSETAAENAAMLQRHYSLTQALIGPAENVIRLGDVWLQCNSSAKRFNGFG